MATGLFSGVLNVLMLAGAIYMLQVYDRVLTSRSLQTLVGLTALLGLVFLVQGILDIIRQRLLTRIGASIDRQFAPQVFRLIASMPVRAGTQMDAQQPARDLVSVRGSVTSKFFVQTGERTALAYLTKPIRDPINRAFRER